MKELLADFRQTVEDAAVQLSAISESDSQTAAAEGKWSPKEIIGHLVDSAANNHIRFVKAQLSDELTFPGYEQEKWVSLQDYNHEPWAQLVQLWRLYNLHLVHLMSQVPKETLQRSRTRHNLHEIAWQPVPKEETVTLEYFMRDYVAHMKNHLAQILVNGEWSERIYLEEDRDIQF